jgi:hypothetical protein
MAPDDAKPSPSDRFKGVAGVQRTRTVFVQVSEKDGCVAS